MIIFLAFLFMILSVVVSLFFLSSKKNKTENLLQNPFECGFTSHFYSRHSFSIHYFMVSLIFLLLDLEICLLFPFVTESITDAKMLTGFALFILALLMGLLKEWQESKLEWVF